MATGYTAAIYDGISFEDFALNCAKAFGALIHMRDESRDKQITLPKASSYDEDELKRALEDLDKLLKMSPEEIFEATIEYNKKAMDSYKKSMEDSRKKNAQLQSMRDKVVSWQPPTTDHEHLKSFMLEQIDETIKWDVDLDKKPPENISVNEWFETQHESAQWSIDYHKKNASERSGRDDDMRQWIIDLFVSLGLGEQVENLKDSQW